MKKLLALLLCLCLCLGGALAAEEPAAPEADAAPAPEADAAPAPEASQTPSGWAVPYLADAYALKLVDDNYGAYIRDPISPEALAAMSQTVAEKLRLLDVDAQALEPMEITGVTRQDAAYALYEGLRGSSLPGSDTEPVDALVALGVMQGDGSSLALERVCTYQEAMVMAVRLVLAEYDAQNAGSRGLLWKAVNGENTLYLLGTYHVDRGNVYPFHKTLREAITGADQVTLELDFNDQAGMGEFAAMQAYSDGTGLRDHVSPELYGATVALFANLGMDEATVNCYKPWALANTLTSMVTNDTGTSAAPMAVDLYVNAAAANAGVPVTGAESYALQGGIFDSLSPEYQETYLASCVELVNAALSGASAEPDQETQAALEEQTELLDAIMEAWKTGDVEGFESLYNKEAIVHSDDELNAKLFTDRDPGMVEVAESYLEQEGEHVNFMAVGAGHMVAPGGIVPELQALGYQVTQIK